MQQGREETLWAVDDAATVSGPDSQRKDWIAIPERIGPYHILDVIGKGGQGRVYLAQHKGMPRRVALKLIRGEGESKRVIARFEQERLVLGLMEHPNIAKVFNFGATKSGHPYFVMEYISGAPITEHARSQQLDTDDILRLFVPVCEAVQHAHHRGIIHRDLKPSNILVATNGRAIPKIIDFGVAKALEGLPLSDVEEIIEEKDEIFGTLPYMSPEHVLPDIEIDTRADIYSLGIVLYELVTGVHPWDIGKQHERPVTLDEIRDTIALRPASVPSISVLLPDRGERPTPMQTTDPWSLSRRLRGDLDAIVLRCLEKDRVRRYQTADELKGDLVHCLENLPVSVRPNTLPYRLTKFARRRRWQIATGSLAAMLAGLAMAAFPSVASASILAVVAFIVGISVGLPGPTFRADTLAPNWAMTLTTIIGLALVAAAPIVSDQFQTHDITTEISETQLDVELVDPNQGARRRVSTMLACEINHPEIVMVNSAFRMRVSLDVRPVTPDESVGRTVDLIIDRLHKTGAMTMNLNLAGADVSPSGSNKPSGDGSFSWSVAPKNTGPQEGFLTANIESARLNPASLAGPIILAEVEKTVLNFSVYVRERASNWLRLAMYCIGGPLVIAQTISWGYKGYQFVQRRRASRRSRLIVPPC